MTNAKGGQQLFGEIKKFYDADVEKGDQKNADYTQRWIQARGKGRGNSAGNCPADQQQIGQKGVMR